MVRNLGEEIEEEIEVEGVEEAEAMTGEEAIDQEEVLDVETVETAEIAEIVEIAEKDVAVVAIDHKRVNLKPTDLSNNEQFLPMQISLNLLLKSHSVINLQGFVLAEL